MTRGPERAALQKRMAEGTECGILSANNDEYLDLLKRCLTAWIYVESSHRPLRLGDIQGRTLKSFIKRLAVRTARQRGYQLSKLIPFDPEMRASGRDWPGFGYTMVGLRRLDNIQACVEDVLRNNVPGDLLEAGVWRGGAAIFMKAVLDRYGVVDRAVWLADSFAGLPKPNQSKYPADTGYDLSDVGYLKVDLEEVKANFKRFGLLDANVKFLEGWFSETLPNAPIRRLAVLRLDADLYESTMDALAGLYHRVSAGGYVIIDDYHPWPNCRRAVDEFRERNAIVAEIREIDGLGVYWQVL